jgi:crotonobetainyl-CoA:carnitine CoA-transferase CaiB-like acyl-CoA transferase
VSQSRLALSGIRIADLTQVWAGPKCTAVLAELGADVIKVESPARTDPARGNLRGVDRYPNRDPGAEPWNRSASFNNHNRGKRSLTLDLRAPEGIAAFKDLVRVSDVVTENFSASVLERLGLGYEELRKVKPDIILLSMPGFGSYGPDRDFVAWANTVEGTAGLSRVMGYEDETPVTSGHSFSDPLSGMFGAAAVLTALRERRLTGEGQHIELAQIEAMVNINTHALLDWQMNARVPEPQGNIHPEFAPHGTYPTAEHDTWVALVVRDDADWLALRRVLGDPGWAADPGLATAEGRRAERARVDAEIGAWTRRVSVDEATAALQAAGLPAARVAGPRDILADPHLQARGRFWDLDHPDVGRRQYYAAFPVSFSEMETPTPRSAPLFGEHNAEILGEVLGRTSAEIDSLAERQITSTRPI